MSSKYRICRVEILNPLRYSYIRQKHVLLNHAVGGIGWVLHYVGALCLIGVELKLHLST